MIYLVYRNLHARSRDERWSICSTTPSMQSRKKVLCHAGYLTLRDCHFIVKASRLDAFRAGGGREPFAWVAGELMDRAQRFDLAAALPAQPVTFNPFAGNPETFTTRDARKLPVHRAEWCQFGDIAIAYGLWS